MRAGRLYPHAPVVSLIAVCMHVCVYVYALFAGESTAETTRAGTQEPGAAGGEP